MFPEYAIPESYIDKSDHCGFTDKMATLFWHRYFKTNTTSSVNRQVLLPGFITSLLNFIDNWLAEEGGNL